MKQESEKPVKTLKPDLRNLSPDPDFNLVFSSQGKLENK